MSNQIVKCNFVLDVGLLLRDRVRCFLKGQEYVKLTFNEEKGWFSSYIYVKFSGDVDNCTKFARMLDRFGLKGMEEQFNDELRLARLRRNFN